MGEYMKRSEYISREAAIKALSHGDGCGHVCKHSIERITAADVVEVVRCRDCRYRDPEDKKCDSGALERAGCVFPVDDDYFCAYGKR